MAIEPNADKSSIFQPKKERKAEWLVRRSGVGWGAGGEVRVSRWQNKKRHTHRGGKRSRVMTKMTRKCKIPHKFGMHDDPEIKPLQQMTK